MTRTGLAGWCLVAVLAASAGGAAAGVGAEDGPRVAPARPPNVVLILADDLGWGDVGFQGRREWATPNLDALAAGGVRLDRFYAPAVVCAPSRAAMLSGRSTIHCGVSRNDDDLPAAEVTMLAR